MDKKDYSWKAIEQRLRDRLTQKKPANQFQELRAEIQRRYGTRKVRSF